MPFNFRYLFRYRDLLVATLDAHRDILAEHQACWWGWWKRPAEPGHLAVWDALSQQTTGAPVEIGLYNSGDNTVYRARIDKVVSPATDKFGAFIAVRPPDTEEHLIPGYYRSSNFSRAWMRLIDIETEPCAFFEEASFAAAPPLPQYSQAALARLTGKVILDGAELRAMDTTIWEVRPRLDNDPEDRFIAASFALSSPVAASPTAAVGDWLLHLTDLHYAEAPHRAQHRFAIDGEDDHPLPSLADAINASLRGAKRSVGAVLVTGDLTYLGTKAEFDTASRELYKLTTGLLGLSLDHVMVIPGNHDISWSQQDTYDPEVPVSAAPAAAMAPYRDFFRSLFRYEPSPDLSMARRYVFPGGQLVDIVALNSSSLEQGRNFLAGMGRVQEQAYETAANALGWHLNRGCSLRIVALHHHVALTENLESAAEYSKGFGIAIDAPRLLRRAARDGVHLVVHGHKHRAFVWRVRSYELPEHAQNTWDLGSVNVLGGGSAGSIDTEAGKNYFHLLRFKNGILEVEMYRSDQGGTFELFSSWSAAVGAPPPEEPITAWSKT